MHLYGAVVVCCTTFCTDIFQSECTFDVNHYHSVDYVQCGLGLYRGNIEKELRSAYMCAWQERGRLTAAERRLGELQRLGLTPPNGQCSPACSSDTEEVHYNI